MAIFNWNTGHDLWIANVANDPGFKDIILMDKKVDELLFAKSQIASLFELRQVANNKVDIPIGDKQFRPFKAVGRVDSTGQIVSVSGVGVSPTYQIESWIRRNGDWDTLRLLRQLNYSIIYDINDIQATGADFMSEEQQKVQDGIGLQYEDDTIEFMYSEKHLSFISPTSTNSLDANGIDCTQEICDLINSGKLVNSAYNRVKKVIAKYRKEAGTPSLGQVIALISVDFEDELMMDRNYVLWGSNLSKEEIADGFSGKIGSVLFITVDRLHIAHPDLKMVLLNRTRVLQYMNERDPWHLEPSAMSTFPRGTVFGKMQVYYNFRIKYNTNQPTTGIYLLRDINTQTVGDVTSVIPSLAIGGQTYMSAFTTDTLTGANVIPFTVFGYTLPETGTTLNLSGAPAFIGTPTISGQNVSIASTAALVAGEYPMTLTVTNGNYTGSVNFTLLVVAKDHGYKS